MSEISDANEAADLLLKIKQLLEPIGKQKQSKETLESVSIVSATSVDRDEDGLYKQNLHELRDLYRLICKSYDKLRAKSISMLAGEVAIVGFLFSGGVPFPHIVYGVVFYGIGILLLGLSFVTFLWIMSPDQWIHPVDLDNPQDLRNKFKSKNDYLQHLVEEYIMAIQTNSKKLTFRSNPFVLAMYMLSVAIFVMLMLKYGGGKI